MGEGVGKNLGTKRFQNGLLAKKNFFHRPWGAGGLKFRHHGYYPPHLTVRVKLRKKMENAAMADPHAAQRAHWHGYCGRVFNDPGPPP
jgi:hypothetical protein